MNAEDRTAQFIEILNAEVKQFSTKRSKFLESFKETDFDYIVNGWKAKVKRCQSGDQSWGFFTAKKPVA